MKKDSYIKVLAIALITTSVYSCSFFKELTNNDIETETEEDFIFEEILILMSLCGSGTIPVTNKAGNSEVVIVLLSDIFSP